MSGGGVGGALGAGLGMLLAPETGGMSLLLPAGLGAAGGALGAGLTGGNPLTSGLLGGAGGLAGGFLSGLLSPGADAADAAASAAGDPFAASAADTAAPDLASEANPLDMSSLGETPTAADAGSSGLNNLAGASGASASSAGTVPAGGWGKLNPITGGMNPADPSASSGLGSLLSKQNLPYVGLGLSALGALLPQGSNPVNIGGNAANVQATNPGFSAPLPQYNYNNVQTPYTGNWYTYGQRPVTPMVQNTVTPAKRGGLMRHHYAMGGQVMPMRPMMSMQRPQMPMQRFAMGGRVQGFAMGGMPPQGAPPMGPPQGMPPMAGPPPQGMPPAAPQGMPQGPQGGPPQDPRAQAMQFALGQKLGKLARSHIAKQSMFSADGMVNGPGKGQDDAVPAKLSKDEYVIPSEVVSQLGDGSSSAGGKELDKMVHKVRAHKTSHGKGFPPKAHSPLAYIGKR